MKLRIARTVAAVLLAALRWTSAAAGESREAAPQADLLQGGVRTWREELRLDCLKSETLESIAEAMRITAERPEDLPPGEAWLDSEMIIQALECKAHETHNPALCERLLRGPGGSVHAFICATDVYGRDYARQAAVGTPSPQTCRSFLSATFLSMDHEGLDIPGLIPEEGWARMCRRLAEDFRDRTLTICQQVIYELGKVLKPGEAARLQMEYSRNVCPSDIGAVMLGDDACEVTSNPFDQEQCLTNARTAAAFRQKAPRLCGTDALCLSAVTPRPGFCERKTGEVISAYCRHKSLYQDMTRRSLDSDPQRAAPAPLGAPP